LLAAVTHGDVVIIPAVDRLSRDTTDLLLIARDLQKAGAGLRSIAESVVDTTSDFAGLVPAMLGVAAKLERRRIKERTERGRADASAADLLAEHALASGRLQLSELAGEVLGVGRDAGVAENHARQYATDLCNKKAEFNQGIPHSQIRLFCAVYEIIDFLISTSLIRTGIMCFFLFISSYEASSNSRSIHGLLTEY
jgi:hypothetical protein